MTRAARASIADVVVDAASPGDLGTNGNGLWALDGADVTLDRVAVREVLEVGVVLQGATTVTGHDLAVHGTAARACAGPDWEGLLSCGEDALGNGISVLDGAALALERFDVSGSALAGLHVVGTGEATATDGLLRDNTVGLVVANEGIDVARAFPRVALVGNERDLQVVTLTAPSIDDLPSGRLTPDLAGAEP